MTMIPSEILDRARNNLMLRSRTANGIVDTTASRDKSGVLMVESGDEAAKTVIRNFEDAITYAWQERDLALESPDDLRRLIETLAAKVNRGIIKEGNLIRAFECNKSAYVRIAELDAYMERFYRDLFEMLKEEPGNPIKEAAFIEYGIDGEGHFFSDGCGKCAMVAASWVLFRRGHKLPDYSCGRKAYYSDITGFEEFSRFYEKLF